jgi:hypothetical protein
MSSRGNRPRNVHVLVDGKPFRTVRVRDQKLYELVALPRAATSRLELRLDAGVAGYAFTFG